MVKKQNPTWLPQAKKQLKEIYTFYKPMSNGKVARKRIDPIIDAANSLVRQPLMGKIETVEPQSKQVFRSFVVGDYKIIYYIREDIIKIAAIFDCRQNPSNLCTMLKL
ncbi:type II toxin-antitoxin system RelE/ParE family toxin [Parabacteroides sp.]